ncbi:AFG1/ZapE family ATPase, partial [Klebsiella pneumoniae]
GKARGKPATIRVKGRDVAVPEEAAGVARVPFADLCAKPLGASDYLALVSSIHTLILEDIPVMGEENRNEAKRFITLVDTLYE